MFQQLLRYRQACGRHINYHQSKQIKVIYLLFFCKVYQKQIIFEFQTLTDMYPNLQDRENVHFRKTISPSDNITNTMLELKNKFTISSFKPHLNYYELHLNLIVNNNQNLPLKIIFLRGYPSEQPLVYCQKWISHPMIKPETCQIEYSQKFPWKKSSSLTDTLIKIQQQFSQNPPNYKSQAETAIAQIEQYQKDVESLRNRPQGTQPPPPPQINFQNILKVFEYQENLKAQCEDRNSTYLFTAQEYSENVQRVKCISERFGKGKILREMEKELSSVLDQRGLGVDQIMKQYYDNRKKYYKMKFLKEKYLEI